LGFGCKNAIAVITLQVFYASSVGAAAALLGLLFVAITLAPAKVFGFDADPKKRSGAITAFTALSNVFFVSLAALTPRAPEIIIAVAAIAIWYTFSEVATMVRRHPSMRGLHIYGITSFVIYAVELVLAVRLAIEPANHWGLIYVVFGLYAFSLRTAWNLLGANSSPADTNVSPGPKTPG
jgi:hypothetical protein